jgi:hypothetical protein
MQKIGAFWFCKGFFNAFNFVFGYQKIVLAEKLLIFLKGNLQDKKSFHSFASDL